MLPRRARVCVATVWLTPNKHTSSCLKHRSGNRFSLDRCSRLKTDSSSSFLFARHPSLPYTLTGTPRGSHPTCLFPSVIPMIPWCLQVPSCLPLILPLADFSMCRSARWEHRETVAGLLLQDWGSCARAKTPTMHAAVGLNGAVQ